MICAGHKWELVKSVSRRKARAPYVIEWCAECSVYRWRSLCDSREAEGFHGVICTMLNARMMLIDRRVRD